jgi:hypothetical protein
VDLDVHESFADRLRTAMDISALDARARPQGTVHDSAGEPRRSFLRFAGIVIVSLIGPLLFILGSSGGVHASPDSFTYLGAAHSLVAGEGWTYPYGDVGAPVTLFPPVFPILLAIPEILGVSVFDWVMWQNAVFLAIFSFLVGITVLHATRDGQVPAILAVLLVQLGTPTIVVYAHIWSEALFYPIVIVVLAALGRYLATRKSGWLVVAAAASSFGMLTRYAGLSLFLTACLLLAAWPAHRPWDRLRRPGLFAAIALPLNGIWLWRNYATSGTLTGNNDLVHTLTLDDALEGLMTLRTWFVPAEPGWPTRLAMLVLVVSSIILLFLLVRMLSRGGRSMGLDIPPVVITCSGYAVVHVAFIAVANAYSTRSPPFNDRIMGSVFAPVIIAIVTTGHAMWRATFPQARFLRPLLICAGITLLAASLLGVTSRIEEHYGTERGSFPFYRRLSRTIDDVIAPDSVLYSNRANIAWFLTGRPVASLPRSCRGGQVLSNPTYGEELLDVRSGLGNSPLQVLFFPRSPRCEPFSMEGLKDALRVERVGPKGDVWVLEGPAVSTKGG